MRALRRHVASMAAVILAAGASCSSSQTSQPDFQRYLDDASFRRSELLASLVNPGNGYSQLRIAHYASGDANDWDLLPEWNPPVERIVATELDSPAGASTTAFSGVPASLELPKAISSLDDPALLALGEAAFSRYPTQLASYVRVGLSSRTAASRYGLWMDAAGGLGGVVRARMADGSVQLGLTCSTCHSKPSGSGAIAAGVPNASLDVGTAMLDAQGAITGPTSTDPIAAWGPGRLDVTTIGGHGARAHTGPATDALSHLPAARRDGTHPGHRLARHSHRDAHHHVERRDGAAAADRRPRPGGLPRFARRRAPLGRRGVGSLGPRGAGLRPAMHELSRGPRVDRVSCPPRRRRHGRDPGTLGQPWDRDLPSPLPAGRRDPRPAPARRDVALD